MTLVFMFPGQSSRYPGMLQKLAQLHPPNAALLAEASALLGRDLAAHYAADNAQAYATNTDVQVGVFLANHLFLQILHAEGVRARVSLGLSLGEYNHLVHIEALSFAEALRAVVKRGEAYDAGPRGAMASVFPVALDELQQVARRAAADTGAVLEVVNLNSPRQQVLSGEAAALDRALQILEQEFFVQATVIERQVPMHCSIFEPAARRFRATLEQLSFRAPTLPYLPNRLGQTVPAPTREDFVELLATHVHSPVLWRASVDHLVQRLPDPVFVEVGPMAVLHNLLDRKWHKVPRYKTDSAEGTAEHLRAVCAELRGRVAAEEGA